MGSQSKLTPKPLANRQTTAAGDHKEPLSSRICGLVYAMGYYPVAMPLNEYKQPVISFETEKATIQIAIVEPTDTSIGMYSKMQTSLYSAMGKKHHFVNSETQYLLHTCDYVNAKDWLEQIVGKDLTYGS